MDLGNIKPWQHCNYVGIHLNTLDSKILANGFILVLSRQTWQRISPEIDAFNEGTLATESNSKFTKNSTQNNLESKNENFDDH